MVLELIISMKVHYHIHFDRYYVVTKFELPKVEDLKLATISYESNCQYLGNVMNLKDYLTENIQDIRD